jgi:hypothetical protein
MDDIATLDTPATTEAVAPVADTPAVETAPAVDATPAPDAVETAAPETPEVVEDDPFGDVTPDKVDENGKLYSCSKTKWDRMWGSDKFKRSLEEAVGPNPSVEVIQEHWKRSLGSQALLDDWNSGEPDSVKRAADFMLLKAPPATISHLAERALEMLPQVAPEAYQQITGQVQNQMLDSVYQHSIQTGDANLFKACQNMELALTGRFRTETDFQAPDPQAQQYNSLQEQLNAYRAREQAQQQQHYQSLAQQIDTQVEQAKSAEIEKMIPKEVADAYRGKPEWNQLNLLLKSEIDGALNNNPIRRAELMRDLRNAKTSPSEQTRGIVDATVRRFAADVLARRAKPIIDKFAATAVAANAKVHQTQAKLQARREPAGLSGTASPNSNRIAQWKAEGVPFDEQLRRFSEG